MQTLGLLGMYFDAVVVEVFTFIQIVSGHTVRLKELTVLIYVLWLKVLLVRYAKAKTLSI